MKNLPPIFVINLPKDTQKKANISELLKSFDLGFAIVDAVNGSDLSVEQIAKVVDRKKTIKNRKRELSAGEIGCALSHIGVWKKMLTDDIKAAIILEDDATFGNDFINIIKADDELPDDLELLLLGHGAHNKCYIKHSTLKGHLLARLITIRTGTHAYIVTKQGAEKLINATKKLANPIDLYTGNKKYVNVYAIFPRVSVANKQLISTIATTREISISLKNSGHYSTVIKIKAYLKRNITILNKLSKYNKQRRKKSRRILKCFFKKLIYKIYG